MWQNLRRNVQTKGEGKDEGLGLGQECFKSDSIINLFHFSVVREAGSKPYKQQRGNTGSDSEPSYG